MEAGGGGINGGTAEGSPAPCAHRAVACAARRRDTSRRRRPRAGDAVRGSPELWTSTASGAGGAAQSAPRRGVGAHGERSGAGQRRGGAERVGADRGRGRPRVCRPRATRRPRANRGGTAEYLGVGSMGNREIRRHREDSGRLGLGFQGGISSSTTKQNFSAWFIWVIFGVLQTYPT